MGLLDSLPISYNQIILYSAIGFTAGMLLRQKQIEKFSGYGLVAGVAWWGIKEVQALLNIDFL